MKLTPPELDAPAEEWRTFAVQVHACQEQWGKSNMVALGAVAVTVVLAVGGSFWATADWHGQTTQRLDYLSASISTLQSSREQSRRDRDQEMKDLGDRIDRLQDKIDDSLRAARR